jgi:hypothetical protein
MGTGGPVEAKLRRMARIQSFILGFVIMIALGVGVSMIVLISDAQEQAQRVKDQAQTNCYNIEIQRLYHEEIVAILQPYASDKVTNQIRSASRTAADAMITTDCQEAQG